MPECTLCGKDLKSCKQLALLSDGRHVCPRCQAGRNKSLKESRRIHLALWPKCGVGWHDSYDDCGRGGMK